MKEKEGKRRLYVRFFLVLSILIFVLLISLSFVLTKNFERIVQKKIFDDTAYSLEQSSKFAHVVADTLAKLTYQIYIDPTVGGLMNSGAPDVFELQPLMHHLVNYSNVIPFIDSVYVYDRSRNTVYVGSSYQNGVQSVNQFDDSGFLKILNNPGDFRVLVPIPRIAEIETLTRSQTKYFYTFYYYDWLNEKKQVDSAVAVNVSASWLNSVISTKSNGSDTVIIDRNGTVISDGGTDYPMMTDVAGIKGFKSVFAADKSGYATEKIKGRKLFIAYTGFDDLGWKYLRIMPYVYVESEINQIRSRTALVAVIILIAGILLSLISSKKLYQPVEAISKNLLRLEEEQKKATEKLKNGFLSDVLFDRVQYDVDETQKLMNKYLIDFHPEGAYYVCLLRIDDYRHFVTDITHRDQREMMLAIRNRAFDICSKYFEVESVKVEDNDTYLILNQRDETTDLSRDVIAGLFSELQSYASGSLNVSLTMTISERGTTIRSVNQLYRETLKAASHRIFLGSGSIIFARDIVALDENRYSYPEGEEKKLLNHILSGDIDAAKQKYLDIINDTSNYSVLVLKFVFSRLAYTVSETLMSIQGKRGIQSFFADSGLFIEVGSYESLDDLNREFLKMLDDHVRLLNDRRNSKSVELVAEIEGYVHSNYADASLSIDTIAGYLKLSSAHIERVYKQYSQKTIHSLITEIRMSKAKELLLETDMSISRVGQNVGYNYSSYFCIVFKRQHGLTPSDFRSSSGPADEIGVHSG